MRRIHRGRLTILEFGSRKLEQLVNLLIAGGMVAGAAWILLGVFKLVTGSDAPGSPAGFAVAGIAAGVNLYVNVIALDGLRRAAQGGGSLIMQGQLQARIVKVVSSVFVQLTLTIAALSIDATVIVWADVIGALFVCAFIIHSAFGMIKAGLPDVIDRSVADEAHAAINRMLAKHFDDYERLDRVRTRRSGEMVYAEVALAFNAGLTIGEVDARIDAMKASLREELGEADISILAAAC
jgi:divalent metal cation (Fe/Co/Zn/Cd) transporter